MSKQYFGEHYSERFKIGDLVQWKKFNQKENEWEVKYGVVLNIKNEIRSNRLVSITYVYANETSDIMNFFTISLKPVCMEIND